MTEEECHLVERVMEQKFVDTKQQEQKKEVNSVSQGEGESAVVDVPKAGAIHAVKRVKVAESPVTVTVPIHAAAVVVAAAAVGREAAAVDEPEPALGPIRFDLHSGERLKLLEERCLSSLEEVPADD